MVFSDDVLFLHVPKAGGVSVAHYLLDVLPRPVTYVAPGHLGHAGQPGLVHVPGLPHKPLREARAFLRERGLDLDRFRVILAVVRNPYDIVVSNYAYQRRDALRSELIDEAAAPPRPAPADGEAVNGDLTAIFRSLTPGLVARIEPTGTDRPRRLKLDVARAAARLGRPLDLWEHEGVLYVALAPPAADDPSRRPDVQELAEAYGFRDFVLEENRRSERPWLSRLFDFYHLDGVAPANLRVIRFEHLAADLGAALAEVGIRPEIELPWLNRSERGAYADYYDAETEAIVYEQARWLFDAGAYERLPLAPRGSAGGTGRGG